MLRSLNAHLRIPGKSGRFSCIHLNENESVTTASPCLGLCRQDYSCAAQANALRTKLRRLISNEPRLGERLEVHAMDAIGERLYEQHFGHPKIASPEVRRRFVTDAATAVPDLKFSLSFLLTEWEELVDAWQL